MRKLGVRLGEVRDSIGLVQLGGSSGRDCCSELEPRVTVPEAPRGWGSIPNLLRWGGGGPPDEPMLAPRWWRGRSQRYVSRVLRMVRIAWSAGVLVLGVAAPTWAHQSGFEVSGCSGCHGGGAAATVSVTTSATSIVAGQSIPLTITVASPIAKVAGMYLLTTTGKFSVGTGLRLWPDGGVTHSQPAQAIGGQATFHVTWTAPTQPAMGGADFVVFAVAGNGDGTNRGDGTGGGFASFAYGCGAGTKYYRDNDGDGYGSINSGYTVSCAEPQYYSLMDGDCNDNDARVAPGKPEVCDGRDNDCNGVVDDGLEMTVLCEDKDHDGHGVSGGMTKIGCGGSNVGFGLCDDDCDDTDATIYPGAMETCNYRDDNCNGKIDEGARKTCGVGWCRRYASGCTDNCTPGPPRAEQCNAFDDDCDGVVDNGTDLELCGPGLACREGYCVPGDTGGSDNGTTTGGGGDQAESAPHLGNSGGCTASGRRTSTRCGLALLLAGLAWAARRRKPPPVQQ